MRTLLTSSLDLIVKNGFLYVPLPFDPSVEQEISEKPAPASLLAADGKFFVKALRLESILDHIETIDPEWFREPGTDPGDEDRTALPFGEVPVGEVLGTILFEVAPRFLRRSGSLSRKHLEEGEILDLLTQRIRIPSKVYEDAGKLLEDPGAVRRSLRALEDPATHTSLPREGYVSPEEIREWIRRALAIRKTVGEKDRLTRMLACRESLEGTSRKHTALLFLLAGEGSLEIDGFGFERIGARDEYVIYKRTGQYALQDYYGRLYLFPDCRVAVFSTAPSRPFVMERYKHPFLEGYEPGQPICIRDGDTRRDFSAAAVIRSLEEGIGALLRGYSYRRRNGYHGLDRVTEPIRMEDPADRDIPWENDPPFRRMDSVPAIDFEEYRIPNDHPGIVTGEIEVTNEMTL